MAESADETGGSDSTTKSNDTTPPFERENIPLELRERPHWVTWRYETRRTKDGTVTPTKTPFSPSTGRRASVTDPSQWSTFEEAIVAARRWGQNGIGLVFVKGDGLIGFDLDGCRDAATGRIAPWAIRIVEVAIQDGCHVEVSPSASGVKVIGRGIWQGTWNKKSLPAEPRVAAKSPAVEAYSRSRYFTVTGDLLDALAPRMPTIGSAQRVTEVVEEVVSESAALGVILAKARAARNAAKFEALFDRGDVSGYDGDASRADLALCRLLSFWSEDPVTIDRLFRRSALMRDKWDEPRGNETYGQQTISKALAGPPPGSSSSGATPGGPTANGNDGGTGGGGVVGGPAHGRDAAGSGDQGATGAGRRWRGGSQGDQLSGLAMDAGWELWRTPAYEAFARVPSRGHMEVVSLDEPRAGHHLSVLFHQTHAGRVPTAHAISDALNSLRARALIEGPERPVFLRVGQQDGRLYLDLADDQWRAIEIDERGWRLVPRPPVMFRRTSGMRPLPEPVPGGHIDQLLPFVNLEGDAFRLLSSVLVAAYFPTGPYPILIILGEQGTAKSTLSRIFVGLADPHEPAHSIKPKSIHDLIVAADNQHVLAFDNLSSLSPDLGDALCALATGGGVSTRELYTNKRQVNFAAVRPFVINSIGDVATRADLLERSILLELQTIGESARRAEADLWPEFDRARPTILGALMDAVSMALRNGDARPPFLARMADFTRRAYAAAPALGWSGQDFVAAYRRNLAASSQAALDAGTLTGPLISFAETVGDWEGTATDLLTMLTGNNPDLVQHREWPRTPNVLTRRLKELAPALRAAGVSVWMDRSSARDRRRVVHIRWDGVHRP